MTVPDEEPGRRGFLRALAAAIGGIIAAVLTVPAVRFVVFPARRRIVQGPTDFIPVADASAVGDRPLRVEIVAAVQRDAWARVENVHLGAAWLVRAPSGEIRAFTTTCPHLGCSVDFDPGTDSFRCPCHSSAFSRAGERLGGPAKRGLDPLPLELGADGRIAVRFRRYKSDIAEREEA